MISATALLSGSVFAQDGFNEQSFIDAREQGVLYWKKKRYLVSKRSLLQAVNSPNGKRDFKTLYYLALVHHKLLQFGPTLTYIDLATTIEAGSQRRKASLLAIKEEIDDNYGFIKLVSAPENRIELGTFKLKPLTTFLNKQKRRYVEHLRELHETRAIRLPKRLYLPYGSYNVSGLHVDLTPQAGSTELGIFLDEAPADAQPVVNHEGSGSSNILWIVGSVGATAAVGIATFLILSNTDVAPSNEFRISVRN